MNLTQDHVQENESLFYLHRGLNGGMDFADFCLFFLCLFALVGVFHQQKLHRFINFGFTGNLCQWLLVNVYGLAERRNNGES